MRSRTKRRPRSAAGWPASPSSSTAHDMHAPEALGRQSAAGGVDRQAIPQPRHQLPRPDPGGKHGPVAGGRQVRAGPRLQVLDLRHVVDSPGDQPFDRRSQPHDPHPRPHAYHGRQSVGRRPPRHATPQAAAPTLEETAKAAGLSVAAAGRAIKANRRMLSLDEPLGDARRKLPRRTAPRSTPRRSAAWHQPGCV